MTNNSSLKQITHIFLQGLVTLLPLILTIYLIVWLMISAENVLGKIIKTLIHENAYVPGMGVVVGIAVIFGLGMLMRIYVFQRIVLFGESIMEKIPLVKTIFNALRDTMNFVAKSPTDKVSQVVVAHLGEQRRIIGFITRDNCQGLPDQLAEDDFVAVYFPMSYQIGGYTVYMPKEAVEPLDIDLETGMRLAVTGGLGSQKTQKR